MLHEKDGGDIILVNRHLNICTLWHQIKNKLIYSNI